MQTETRHAKSCREALEHILNYLAIVDDSELRKAESAAKDAAALAYTRREWVVAKRLENMAIQIASSNLAGIR